MFFDFLKKLKIGNSVTQHTKSKAEKIRERFFIFRNLLTSNNNVLELMADLSEKLSGEFLFDKAYLEQITKKIKINVEDIVSNLQKLSSDQKYKILSEKIVLIDQKIQELLEKKYTIAFDSYTLKLENITKEMVERVGGKNANLGEVKNILKLPTPSGFAITAYAFKRFMEHNGFLEKIDNYLREISLNNFEQLGLISKRIQEMVSSGEIPDDLEKAIIEEIESQKLKLKNENLRVSVRSSAIFEDSEYSFAGQYYTFLNVLPCDIIQKWKEVVASLFTPRAIFYFKSKGIEETGMVMSVGVLNMIDALAGGVIYTTDPNREYEEGDIIISSVHGLGKCVVDGTISPEIYRVSRNPNFRIIEKYIPIQKKMLFCTLDGAVSEVPLPEAVVGTPSLTDEQVIKLCEFALQIEKHYGCPQDIEWAIDKDGNPYILQTRPLRIIEKEETKPIPTIIKGYNLLIDKGAVACKGVGYGKVHIVRTDEDLKEFTPNSVLVVRHTSPKYVTIMDKASAIITDFGGMTGHMASLAREFQVPTILDTEKATEILRNGQEITVDAYNCNVYEGYVKELIEHANKKRDPFKETYIYKLLQKVVKLIVPLHLSNPDSLNFKPECCETFHDITRYCHEMAIHELFDVAKTSPDEVGAIQFQSNIPMEIWLLDIGEGIANYKTFVKPENIKSVPFKAFFKGLSSMRWPQGQPVDAKGFIDSIFRTVTISEEELRKVGEKNFLIISKDYMNFAIRLGYHFSSVEALVSDNINDNYIKFFFKGGGAVVDRRLRRVRLIKEILTTLDFDVKTKEDVINASLMKYKKDQLENILEIMGRLTVYTKQLDMVMYNDAITDFYIEDFCKMYIKKVA
ncbi:MAG: PEP-utilizing enzyme [Thermodesulfovibrionales bacterium]|nr:PEP-utilizing enzyme [Thermodesulfovibrionales bacterium]